MHSQELPKTSMFGEHAQTRNAQGEQLTQDKGTQTQGILRQESDLSTQLGLDKDVLDQILNEKSGAQQPEPA